MAAPIAGKIGYHAGVNGTVTLEKDEQLVFLWVLGGAGGKFTIDGGADIPLPANAIFTMGLESRTQEWVGVALVFTSTVSYMVQTKRRIGS